MQYETQDAERKTYSILKVLANNTRPLGSLVIARRLKDHGVDLGARAVRYHLRLTDEHGLTRLAGFRDGRQITELGMQELKQAMVKEKVGFALSRIELLTFMTTFDAEKRGGLLPVNVTFFDKRDFNRALKVMAPIFFSGFCTSSLVKVAGENERIGDLTVPEGSMGLATVCSIVVNGTLLQAHVPMNSKFGGLLQMQERKPKRFVDLIHYAGCSLDPSEIFIRACMTSVSRAVKTGEGSILANFREIPGVCRPIAQDVIAKLDKAKLNGVLAMGNISEPVCEMQMELNRVGMILMGGLNPVAAAQEAGIKLESYAMSTLLDYSGLVEFKEIPE